MREVKSRRCRRAHILDLLSGRRAYVYRQAHASAFCAARRERLRRDQGGYVRAQFANPSVNLHDDPLISSREAV